MQRYDYIDSIRGIAALLVVWMHVSEVFRSFLMEKNIDYWVFTIAETVDFGRIGVVAFFAVSGFVIPSSFKYSGLLGVKTFLIKRFFRLYPLFWFSIPLGFLSSWYIWNKEVTINQILANITMVPSIFNQIPIEGLYWTLLIELIFYSTCLALFAFGLLKPFVYLIISTISMIIFVNIKDVNFLYFSIMFWGAVYRCYTENIRFSYDLFFLLAIPLAVIIGLPIYGGYLNTIALLDSTWIKFISSHALGLLLFLVLAQFVKIKLAPFVYLGKISYSVYLLHPVVFYLFYWWAGRTTLEWIREIPLSGWVILMMLFSIIFSSFSYKYIELPSIAYGNKKAYQIKNNA